MDVDVSKLQDFDNSFGDSDPYVVFSISTLSRQGAGSLMQAEDTEFVLRVQALEIYNEQVRPAWEDRFSVYEYQLTR